MHKLHSMLVSDMGDQEFLDRFGFARCKPYTVARWMQNDDEHLWRRNQADRAIRDKLRFSGWSDTNVEYRYNNHGFRSMHDFDLGSPAPGYMFLGCSMTEGIGLNVEDTWAYRLWENMGGIYYNLGQGGTGIETQYRLLRAWAPRIRPVAIYSIGAIVPRREILNDYGTPSHIVGPWSEYDQGRSSEALLSVAETDVSTQRTFDAMRFVARELGIPLYFITKDAMWRASYICDMSGHTARDALHRSKFWHDELGRTTDNFDRVA